MEGGCNEMKIEIMIYTYIAICVSMILYNIIYVFILKHRERALIFDSKKNGCYCFRADRSSEKWR